MAFGYLHWVDLISYWLSLQNSFWVAHFWIIHRILIPLALLRGHFWMAYWYPLVLGSLVFTNLHCPGSLCHTSTHLSSFWSSWQLLIHSRKILTVLWCPIHQKKFDKFTRQRTGHLQSWSSYFFSAPRNRLLCMTVNTSWCCLCTHEVALKPNCWTKRILLFNRQD